MIRLEEVWEMDGKGVERRGIEVCGRMISLADAKKLLRELDRQIASAERGLRKAQTEHEGSSGA